MCKCRWSLKASAEYWHYREVNVSSRERQAWVWFVLSFCMCAYSRVLFSSPEEQHLLQATFVQKAEVFVLSVPMMNCNVVLGSFIVSCVWVWCLTQTEPILTQQPQIKCWTQTTHSMLCQLKIHILQFMRGFKTTLGGHEIDSAHLCVSSAQCRSGSTPSRGQRTSLSVQRWVTWQWQEVGVSREKWRRWTEDADFTHERPSSSEPTAENSNARLGRNGSLYALFIVTHYHLRFIIHISMYWASPAPQRCNQTSIQPVFVVEHISRQRTVTYQTAK